MSWVSLLLTACTGSVIDPVGEPVPDVLLGDIFVLSEPVGGLHHHATVAWGDLGFGVAWATGFEPDTGAWAQVFAPDGSPILDPFPLNTLEARADKPDLAVTASGFTVAFDDRRGGVWLRSVHPSGDPIGPEGLLHSATLEVDAVDLAVHPDGTGTAIWTESGAEGMGPDDGRIVWRGFDDPQDPDPEPRVAEQSSRKTSDAAPLDDGGFVAVWARHHDHPVVLGEVLYEVHGRLYHGDGTTRSFRADDLDDAWPSRPAVAVAEGGDLAVSWRDKTASEGLAAGAYGRLFDPEGTPRGPSLSLEAGDGDRVVVGWAGDLAVFCWQQTDPGDGLPGIRLAVVDAGVVVAGPLDVSEAGGDRDERPSIDVRGGPEAYDVVVVWETVQVGRNIGEGLRGRVVTVRP